jgi:hypothetical protein
MILDNTFCPLFQDWENHELCVIWGFCRVFVEDSGLCGLLCYLMGLTGPSVLKECSTFFFEGWEILDKFLMTVKMKALCCCKIWCLMSTNPTTQHIISQETRTLKTRTVSSLKPNCIVYGLWISLSIVCALGWPSFVQNWALSCTYTDNAW